MLVFGRTYPRRGIFGSCLFKGSLNELLTRDIEPYCVMYFDLNTLKGEDLWIGGKVGSDVWVFPIPTDQPFESADEPVTLFSWP